MLPTSEDCSNSLTAAVQPQSLRLWSATCTHSPRQVPTLQSYNTLMSIQACGSAHCWVQNNWAGVSITRRPHSASAWKANRTSCSSLVMCNTARWLFKCLLSFKVLLSTEPRPSAGTTRWHPLGGLETRLGCLSLQHPTLKHEPAQYNSKTKMGTETFPPRYD